VNSLGFPYSFLLLLFFVLFSVSDLQGDQHVGKLIFRECIRGLLKEKTVFFVTNQLQYLSQCDSVVFIHQGTIHGAGYV
jgi:ABC-type transport system involved in cytochrome bd biosynthesis fused ATPase/permease subunit